MLLVNDELQTDLVCGNETPKKNAEKQEKMLGVTFHNKINFATHLSNIIKKIPQDKKNLLPFFNILQQRAES